MNQPIDDPLRTATLSEARMAIAGAALAAPCAQPGWTPRGDAWQARLAAPDQHFRVVFRPGSTQLIAVIASPPGLFSLAARRHTLRP